MTPLDGASRTVNQTAADPPFSPTAAEELAFPASVGQQAFWFMDRFTGGATPFTVPVRFHLAGDVDSALLRRSLEAIVARHEVLRTVFAEEDEKLKQIVRPFAGVPFFEHDLSALDPESREAEAMRIGTDEACSPFDLARGPLFRAGLIRMGPRESILHVSAHHSVCDGWSIGVIENEIVAFYSAFATGTDPDLPELPIQYADFTLWEIDQLETPELRGQLNYWKNRLRGLPDIAMPTDFPRPAVKSWRGNIVSRLLDTGVAEPLKEFAKREGMSFFVVCLAAYKVLISRYADVEDVHVTVPVAGRQRVEVEPLIGTFINNLILRTDLSGNPTFRELAHRVKETVAEAMARQEYPFERIVQELAPERSTSHNPLAQISFAHQRSFTRPRDFAGLHLNGIPSCSPGSIHDLNVFMVDREGVWRISCDYSTDLYRQETAECLLVHFDRLLREFVRDPDMPVMRADMLAPEERMRILNDWNPAGTALPETETVLDRIARQVAQTPESVAVRDAATSLTYSALWENASELAAQLLAVGIGRGDRVGMAVERGPQAVIAVLGILRAGAAYVPLDPGYPVQRLQWMREDAGIRISVETDPASGELVVNGGAVDSRSPGLLCSPLREERDPNHFPRSGQESDPPEAFPEALPLSETRTRENKATPQDDAYVIFTSGSTGRPKGVPVRHRALLNLLLAAEAEFGFGPGGTWLGVTTLSFDISLIELFLPLMTGGTLRPATRDEAVRGDLLATVLDSETITHLQATPVTWRLLVESGWSGSPALCAITGGEPLAPQLASDLLARVGALWNGYGPTETTVYSTWERITSPDAPISIGRPVANTRVYIVDRAGQPSPVGVPGELWIGGAGVSAGYLGRPDLTAEKFLDNPFAEGRVYRTGDLARWMPDGRLECLGRIDGQIKLRGFRIETGEIEHALCLHSAVKQAVVVLRGGNDDARLVAYLVPPVPGFTDTDTVRDFLSTRLPAYMMPSAWIWLEQLPVTPNGKVDRRALPDPGANSEQPAYEAPADELETRLADLWGDLLHLDRVGRTDHFFHLGGHSLLAVRLLDRMRHSLGVEAPMSAIFGQPTLAGFAAEVRRAAPPGSPAGEPGRSIPWSDRTKESVGDFPLSPEQERLWFLAQSGGPSAAYNVPEIFELRGPLDAGALAGAWDAVVKERDILRCRIVLHEGVPRMERLSEWPSLEITDAANAQNALESARQCAHEPFDLIGNDLHRARLIRVSPEHHILVLVFHHILTDGWSNNLLLRDLVTHYDAARAGQIPGVKETPGFLPWCAWHHAGGGSDVLERSVAYWADQLREASPHPALLPDHDAPVEGPGPAGNLGFDLDAAMSARLRKSASALGATPFALLLAAFSALVQRMLAREEEGALIAVPVANRTASGLGDMAGFFVNMLALPCPPVEGRTGARSVVEVASMLARALEHQTTPLSVIAEHLPHLRGKPQSGLLQTVFSFERTARSGWTLAGLEARRVPVSAKEAKFDFLLMMTDDGEGMTAHIEYDARRFEAASVDRFAKYFLRLVDFMANNPDTPISGAPLADGEDLRLLELWGGRGLPAQQTGSCVDRFDEAAKRAPGARALSVCGGPEDGLQWTYADLDAKAGAIAAGLRAVGVAPGDFVGIALPRSSRLVSAMLGIWKCGAAYVPLDPGYPAERLALMIRDAGVRHVLAADEGDEKFSMAGATVHVPDADPPSDVHARLVGGTSSGMSGIHGSGRPAPSGAGYKAGSGGDADPPDNRASAPFPESPAYAMFTSGSTGVPKGVVIPHRAICRLVEDQSYLRFGPDRVFLHASSPSFDASTLEVWGALLRGGHCVVLADGHVDGTAIARAVADYRVNVVWLTASLFHHLVDNEPETLTGVADVLAGGEALSVPHVRRALERLPGTRFVNGYGPTENTTFTACYPVPVPLPGGTGSLPIGFPVAGTWIELRDRTGHPVLPGAAGELVTGGEGVGLGYLNRPDLTAEYFPVDPATGKRVYRTGDFVRWRADGALQFLGRHDGQVKVRGFRVEPGEIERVLAAHASVARSAVVARPDASGALSLSAYIVPRGNRPDATEILSWLRARLPAYMVPDRAVCLDTLPLTANGKLDVKALPVIDEGGAVAGTLPATDSECRLAQIWTRFLGGQTHCREDDFFAQGGHSILALRMFAAIENEFGCRLPLAVLFEASTLAGLAGKIDAVRHHTAPVGCATLVRMAGKHGLPFFCIHAGDGGILFYRDLARRLGQCCPVYGVEAPWLSGGRVGAAVDVGSVAGAYLEEIRRIQPAGPYRLSGFSYGGVVAFEMARQLLEEGEAVERVVLFDTFNPALPPRRLTGKERLRKNLSEAAALGLIRGILHLLDRARKKIGARYLLRKGQAQKAAADAMETVGHKVSEDLKVIQAREAHTRAMWAYQPGPLAADMFFFAAREPLEGYDYPDDRGWSELVGGRFEIVTVPGTHPTILSEPNVAVVAEALRKVL